MKVGIHHVRSLQWFLQQDLVIQGYLKPDVVRLDLRPSCVVLILKLILPDGYLELALS